MKTIVADKIASDAQTKAPKPELRVSDDIPCEEGVLVAVEILNNKSTYDKLELTSGRMAQVKRGDVIVGALGHRKALFGYSGHLPEKLAPGDIIQVLNIGGVLGICDSINASFGDPFDAKVLGAVLDFPILGERIGVPARAGATTLEANPGRWEPRRGKPTGFRSAGWRALAWIPARPPREAQSAAVWAIPATPSTHSRRRAYRYAVTFWLWKMRVRATRPYLQTLA